MKNDTNTCVDHKRINIHGLVSTVGHEALSGSQGEINKLNITACAPLSYDIFLFHTISALYIVATNTLNLALRPFL